MRRVQLMTEAANAVLNHPDVRSTIQAGDYKIGVENLLADGGYVFATAGSVVALEALGSGVYQGHVASLRGSMGAGARQLGKWALKQMFTEHGALEVRAAVPWQLRAARLYCRSIGLKPEGRDLFHEFFSLGAA